MKLKRVFKSAISLFLVFLLTFGMVIIPPFAQARESIKTFDKSLDVVTDRFIIKYKSDTDKEKIKDVLKYKLQSTRKLGNNKNFDIFITKNKMKTDDLLSEIKLKKFESSIDYIQPDYSISLSSNDPYFSYQWGLENNTVSGSVYGQSIDANVPSAWLESEGSGVIVAVIDTGVDITHEDLADNIWVNTNEIPNNNIDDDNNGYIDDTQGWNFYDDNNTVHEISNLVDEQHGTHETGIISAVKDNGKGITGVAPKAKVLPLKAFSNGTAYTSDIIEAIEYAERNGAKVVNCSWGTTVENSALKETIDLSNMLFACAAGNNGVNIDLSPVYPAAWPNNNIITVASINKDGYLSSFSNYGVNSVDIAAPGEGIMSTLPGNQYGQMSGTSMATPFVSGTIALLPAIYPNISTKEIKTRIEGNTTLLPQFSGKISSGGMLNVCKVITSSESTIIRSPIIDTGDGIESENINKNRSNYFDTKSVQIQSIIVQEGFEGGTLTSSSFTDTYNLPGCSSSITTDQSKVISGMYSFNGKAPTSTEWYDCLYTDRTKVILQAGTTYKVSFNTKTISSPGSGGWFYFLARTPTGGVAQDVNISDWTENVGSITTKSFEFTLKGFDDYYLMWGLRNGGELSIDDIKITYVGITQKDVDWGFEKGSLETSYFTGTYDLAGCSSTITTDPLKVISGMYSFDGKAPITTEWYDCLYTDRSKIMLKANTTYKVSFNTKTISSPGSGGWFYFLARTPTGGVAQDVNISGWTENVGSITTKSFEFTLKGFDDYYLMWGLRNGGELSIDDIQITKASATQESIDWGFEKGSLETSYFTGTYDLAGCSSTITTDPLKVISGMYSFDGKAPITTEWYDCLYTDRSKIMLKANTTYKVSFNTKTISSPGSGGWFYFLARTPTGGVAQDVNISGWTENVGSITTKSFEFTLKGFDDYYLMWGLRNGGELSIDDIQITKASATQESMDWGFERGSFESSNFTDTSDVSGCSSTITTDPSKVITGMYSFNGKALTSTGWYDCLYTDKTKVILQAGATYKVSFNTKTISNPGSGGWFYFLARTPTGGVYEDVGINTWTDNPGNTSTKSFEFTLKGYDDYYLIWGLRSGGELSIDDIQITSPINLGQTVNGTISGFNTENRYKVNIPQAGVMTANLNVTSGSNYYTVEFYDSNNSLLRKVNNYLTSNSKFMVDVQTPGNYYIKVIKSSTIDLNYTLQVNRKDKLELIQTESDSVNTKLALKVNNPRSIKNAAIVLEYNPTYYSDASSQAANMFENLIGLKTIAVKRIPGVSTSKIVFYYDMEDDFAANMEDQEVIIDYITFNKTSIQGPSIITISPESYVGLYDSTKFILNNGVSFTVSSTSLQTVTSEVYSQAVTQLTSQGSAGITVFWKPGDILDRLDPAIIQRNPKAIEQLRAYKLLHSSVPNSVYGSVYGNVYGGMYNSVYSSVYSGNPSNFKISSVGEVSTFSSLFDPNSYSTISGVIRTPVGSGMNPEKIRVTITDTSTKNTATPVSRSTYPDKTGRFIFKYVPSGINFTISVQDANNLTQSPVEKSIFSSVAKDIGGVLNGEALFVQDIGYFYQFDFNGNGVYNESDEGEYFFNQISTTGVTSGNYLYSGTTTSLSDNPSLNLDKDSEVNVFEASNATTNTWLDNPVDPGSVDTNRYRAEPYSDNIPSSVTPGSSGEFTISFIDNYSETITEDGVKSIAYPDKYYKLVRIDTDSDITISNIQFLDSNTVTIDGVDYHNPRFKMNYMISGNNTKPSYTLKFMLANNSSLKEGYGIPLEKTITNSSYTGTDNVDDTNFDSIKVWKDSAGVEYTLVYVKNGGVAISFKSPSSAEVSFDAIGLKNAVYDILALNDWSNENFLAVTGSKSAIDNAIDNKQGAWAQITKESYEYYTYIYMESQNRLSTYYQRQQFASIAESCVSLLVGIGILAYESRIISMARNRAAFQTGTVILKDTQIMSVARTDTAIAKISDEVALAEEITDTLPSQAIQVGRPSWRQSELDAAADFADYASQKSFIKRVDGTIEECAYGTPGSVRPDLYKSGYSIDVKNYNITTTTGRNNLANNIYNQYLKRVVNLPSGTQQTVLIDARGQVVTDSMIDELVGLINNKTGSNVRVRFMR